MRNKMMGIIGASLLATTLTAGANEGLYMGPSITGYYLDSDRVFSGHHDAVVGGINLGYRFSNDWALEFGVGREVSGDDMDVAKLDYIRWFGDDTSSWRPYFVLGVSYFDLDEDPNLRNDEQHTHQAAVGLGLSKMLSDHWEFRSDVRVLHKIREGQKGVNDGALNLAINYYFNPPAPVVVAPAPAPAPAPVAEPEVRTITVRLNVEFEFDKAVVRAIYGDELQAIANAMKVHDDIELVLEGHTDSRGSDQYNQGLSDRRAAAVKAKLIEMYGIAPNRVSTVGYGESRPIADNNTDEGRARNRRVIGELTYTEVVAD